MRIDKLIQFFPMALKVVPQIFNIEDLQDLDILLKDLDHQAETELVEKVKNWFKTHTSARDALIKFASRNRQIDFSPSLPPSSEVSIIQNLFELRQTNQEVLSQNNQKSPTKLEDDKQ